MIEKGQDVPYDRPPEEFFFKKFFQRQEETGQNDAEKQRFEKSGSENKNQNDSQRHQDPGAGAGRQDAGNGFTG